MASHSSALLLIMKAADMSVPFGPAPPANQRILGRDPSTPKTAPISRVDGYNCTTTRKPVIYQFEKILFHKSGIAKALQK